MPSVSGMSEIAASLRAAAGDPSALPSPAAAASSSGTLVARFLSARPLCQLLYCTTVLFKALCYKIRNDFFTFFNVLFV